MNSSGPDPVPGAPDVASDAPGSRGARPQQSDFDRRYFLEGLGLPYVESEPHWKQSYGAVAGEIVRQLDPHTVLDAGCATGFLVAALVERGVEATGIDISEYAVATPVAGAEGRLHVRSLTEPLEGTWDLISCVEVLEHMAPPDAQAAIDNICRATDRVLFSSTPHDYTEPSHVNVNRVAKWVSWFAQRGFFRKAELDFSSLSPWAMVLERRVMTLGDVVHDYELELAPLREEVALKRRELLRAQRALSDVYEDLTQGIGSLRDDDIALVSSDRMVSLVDQLIGLEAQLAEERYRHDRTLQSLVDKQEVLEQAFKDVKRRSQEANERLREVLSSRSWRTGQALMKPAHRIVRSIRSLPSKVR